MTRQAQTSRARSRNSDSAEFEGVSTRRRANRRSLITPKAFTDQELTSLRFQVPQKRAALVARWLKAGGGLGGKAFGIFAYALPKARPGREDLSPISS